MISLSQLLKDIKPFVLRWLSESCAWVFKSEWDPPVWVIDVPYTDVHDISMQDSDLRDAGSVHADSVQMHDGYVRDHVDLYGFGWASADPDPPAGNVIRLYAKGSGSAVELWVIRSDGSKTQLS